MEKAGESNMRCPYCGRQEVSRTRRHWWERFLFRLRSVYRCGSCSRRFWRPAPAEPPPRPEK
jgi:DNA-directed RNA polymerase subunit RPC12/RpoP